MPSSYPEQIPLVIDILLRLKPRSILDIGTGFGKYGFLAREYLEVWGRDMAYGSFNLTIDGVEPFKKYINPCHRYIYDHIYNESALEFSRGQNKRYDLVLLIDVLEHMDKEQGYFLLDLLLKKNRNILISTPKVFNEQDAVFNNPYEIHRSLWKRKELLKFGNGIVIPFRWSWIVLIGEDYHTLKKYRIKRLIFNFLPGFMHNIF